MANYFAARVAPRKTFSEHLAEAGQRYEQQQQDEVDALQREETVRGIQDKRRLRDIVAATGGNWDQAAQEAAAAGMDPSVVDDLERRGADRQGRLDHREDRAYTLRERANKAGDDNLTRAMKNFDVQAKIGESTETITDEASYQAWRQAASQAAQAAGLRFQAPDTYDPAYIDTIRTRAAKSRQAWSVLSESQKETLGLPTDGSYQMKRDGQVKQITKPRSQERTTLREVYDETSPTGSRWVDQGDALGKPAGKPPKQGSGGGSDPARQKAAKYLLDSGIAISPQEAWSMAGEAAMNPRKFALDAAKAELGGMAPDSPEAFEERVKYWEEFARAAPQRKPAPKPDGAAPPMEAFKGLEEGRVRTFRNGQKWTIQGGQPVRVQ